MEVQEKINQIGNIIHAALNGEVIEDCIVSESNDRFFIDIDEDVRQERILLRGKSKLDKLLDDEIIRKKFLKEFAELSEHYVQISNGNTLEELYFNAQKALAKSL